MNRSTPQWSREAQAFLDFWQALRTPGALMPTSEIFLDRVDARFMPSGYIVEVSEAGAIVRYQGTRLVGAWQRDFTGTEMHDGAGTQYKARSVGNMLRAVEQPCGHFGRYHFGQVGGGTAVAEYTSLPLAVQPGRPPRLVCYIAPQGKEQAEGAVCSVKVTEATWVDIGAGVPTDPPQAL